MAAGITHCPTPAPTATQWGTKCYGYQQLPFQFSLHRLSRTGKLEHRAFFDLSGQDPLLAFAKALVAACGESGPVYVYSASFEKGGIRELAEKFPRLNASLQAVNDRVVDLLQGQGYGLHLPAEKPCRTASGREAALHASASAMTAWGECPPDNVPGYLSLHARFATRSGRSRRLNMARSRTRAESCRRM
ncbi:DUF2779 domain-containing protein [Paraburkholderia sp. WC7.3g]|uniref:DUF2779 domain-containing protein n=1 Tax=Paraburkholderia sp. WC7.3g TaxID=2991070 RepID=UPI003D1A7479